MDKKSKTFPKRIDDYLNAIHIRRKKRGISCLRIFFFGKLTIDIEADQCVNGHSNIKYFLIGRDFSEDDVKDYKHRKADDEVSNDFYHNDIFIRDHHLPFYRSAHQFPR